MKAKKKKKKNPPSLLQFSFFSSQFFHPFSLLFFSRYVSKISGSEVWGRHSQYKAYFVLILMHFFMLNPNMVMEICISKNFKNKKNENFCLSSALDIRVESVKSKPRPWHCNKIMNLDQLPWFAALKLHVYSVTARGLDQDSSRCPDTLYRRSIQISICYSQAYCARARVLQWNWPIENNVYLQELQEACLIFSFKTPFLRNPISANHVIPIVT